VSVQAELVRPKLSRSTAGSPSRFFPGTVAVAFTAAWVLLAVGELSGVNRQVGHDAVADGAMAPGVGVGVFLAGWLVMVAAMMLPATRPALARLPGQSGPAGPRLVARFLSGFAAVWTGAGLAAFAVDTLVHETVEGIPALGSRPSLVGASLLALAGALQLSGSGRHAAAGADDSSVDAPGRVTTTFGAGVNHGVRCLRVDGPLMLVTFGLGANLAAMALLTGVMAAQRSPRWGRQVVSTVGVLLLASAALVAYGPPWLPSPFGVR
jgi:predicted metal-binding membrane protein